jgi:polysaccharide export outer membrane protein
MGFIWFIPIKTRKIRALTLIFGITHPNSSTPLFDCTQSIPMRKLFLLFLALISISLVGCSFNQAWLPGSGALTSDLVNPPTPNNADPNAPTVQLVEVTPAIAQKVAQAQKITGFSEAFKSKSNTVGSGTASSSKENGALIGPGDVLEVNIWEAAPPMLFGVSSSAGVSIVNSSSSRATTLPDQVVNREGKISIPFAGRVQAAGKTQDQIANEIVKALNGKANFPQVIVRLTRNTNANVTVVGEVSNSVLLPLTPKQEKLLDAIAMAGGVKQPINKITVQLARGAKSATMPLETIIKDPTQNIALLPGDVVTAYFQPYSFTSMGATGQNQEVQFEGQGISLAQAMARAGGVRDERADARGVFLFRFENSAALPEEYTNGVKTTDGKVPVIYRINLTDPIAFLTAQNFPMNNKDVLYVSNATSVELQKFLNILVSAFYPVVNAGNISKGF